MIIGNENIVKFLDKSIKNKALAHSYIFYGPKNIGKKTTAHWLASRLLDSEQEKLHLEPDFLETIIEKNIIPKEEIDRVVSRISLSSLGNGYKVLIINHAHLMNRSSANAFLKTLEEPPKKTIILLLTSELGGILPTIVSRSSVLKFNLVAKDKIKNFLKEEQGAKNTQSHANISFGRPGRAIKLLNTDWQSKQVEATQEFYNLFFGDYVNRFKIIAELLKDPSSRKALKGTVNKKEKILKKIDFWMEITRDIFMLKYGLSDEVVHCTNNNILIDISKKQPIKYFSVLAGRLIKMRQQVNKNINIQLMLENLII